MFMTSCKRLRIMKGSEARGLGGGVWEVTSHSNPKKDSSLSIRANLSAWVLEEEIWIWFWSQLDSQSLVLAWAVRSIVQLQFISWHLAETSVVVWACFLMLIYCFYWFYQARTAILHRNIASKENVYAKWHVSTSVWFLYC